MHTQTHTHTITHFFFENFFVSSDTLTPSHAKPSSYLQRSRTFTSFPSFLLSLHYTAAASAPRMPQISRDHYFELIPEDSKNRVFSSLSTFRPFILHHVQALGLFLARVSAHRTRPSACRSLSGHPPPPLCSPGQSRISLISFFFSHMLQKPTSYLNLKSSHIILNVFMQSGSTSSTS